MKTAMYRYMTPNVAEQVMALGEDALMVGERKDVTILFSDIRGYTTMTENFDASEVVTLLNQYFETMVEAVFNFEGTLDKFIGDALMAVFGAPLPLTENHAWMAIRSALDMRRRLAVFNQQRIIENQPKIQIGIGISSGGSCLWKYWLSKTHGLHRDWGWCKFKCSPREFNERIWLRHHH